MKTIYPSLALCGAILAAPCRAQTHSEYVHVPVVGVDPILQTVTEKIPHEICRSERVKVLRASDHSATPSILGAIVGGVVGSAVGDNSRHEPLIIGAGAVLGASVGHDIGHQRSQRPYYVTERRCEVDVELRDRTEVVGYRVSYRYGDTIYHTRTAQHPGETIRVRVDVTPTGD